MSKKKIYSLYGYFGYQNIGDDIMLLNALIFFNIMHKNSIFYVFVHQDYYTRDSNFKDFKNIQVNFIKLSPFINRLLVYYYAYKVKGAIWLGGTCLYETDTSGLQGMFWLKKLIKKYKLLGKSFSFCNIGIGDFTSKKGKNLYGDIISESKYISCRDNVSLNKLMKHPSFSSKFVKGGDLASLIDYKRNFKSEKGVVVFCGHYQYEDNENLVSFYSGILNKIGNLGFRILFVPMHQGKDNDNLFHNKISNNLECENSVISYNPGDAFTYLEKAQLIISMRLHGVFLSDIIGVPNIGVAYHEKVSTYIKNTEVLPTVRNKRVGEIITMEDIHTVMEEYKKPEVFLKKEQMDAVKGLSIFEEKI